MVQYGTENDIDRVRSHDLSIEVVVRLNFHACVKYDILGHLRALWVVAKT